MQNSEIFGIVRIMEFCQQPCPSECPIPLGGCTRNTKQISRFVNGATREIPKVYEFRFCRFKDREPGQRLIQCQQAVAGRFGHRNGLLQVNTFSPATVPDSLLSSRLFHKDSSNRFGGGGEEMATGIPVLSLFHVHQPKIGIVDQGGGLQCLAGWFLREFRRRQLPQFVIHQRQELLGSVGIPRFNLRQNTGHVRHERQAYQGD